MSSMHGESRSGYLNHHLKLRHRFRQVGNFGQSTIRRFDPMNVTEMKHWAARTYEDCLQVSKLILCDLMFEFKSYSVHYSMY
jgi:hypothetical protein